MARRNDFDLTGTQRDAWLEEAELLQRVLARHTGALYLEFTVPRMGRRIDAVVIIGPVIFVFFYARLYFVWETAILSPSMAVAAGILAGLLSGIDRLANELTMNCWRELGLGGQLRVVADRGVGIDRTDLWITGWSWDLAVWRNSATLARLRFGRVPGHFGRPWQG